MKMTVTPESNALVGNPIFVTFESAPVDTVSYSLSIGSKIIYAGSGMGNFKINIAEILDSQFADPEDLTGIQEVLTCLQNESFYRFYFKVSATCTDQSTKYASCLAYRGGISRREFARYQAIGSDIFADKLANPAGNFVFTSRRPDWRIVMKETELYPLVFLYPNCNTFVIQENVSGETIKMEGQYGNLYALNIEALRRKFYDEKGVFANYFDAIVDGQLAFRIGIEQSTAYEDSYIVRFLNSFGVFERMELNGKATVGHEIANEDNDGSYKRYDAINDCYFTDGGRMEYIETVSITTGRKRPDEVRFMLDMLSSGYVYLAKYGEHERRVQVSCEELSFGHRPTSPEQFTLKFTMNEGESYQAQEPDANGYEKARVHQDTFTEQFN